jgi:membrane peptidoglycan carboxypeptidase
LALAYSAASNGGYLPNARIIKNIDGEDFDGRNFSPRPVRQVMSKETANLLLEMMEGVVNKGTATKARIPGFRIGGKTGTAEKFMDGKYSKRNFISSFAAVFPIENPQYVCVISVDSPAYGYHWGNETAAPIVKEIFERLIINNDMNPVKSQHIPQYAHIDKEQHVNGILASVAFRPSKENKVPNFLGKTLKQSIQKAKLTGLTLHPVGTSGRVVWQSVRPGKQVRKNVPCKIKLESM